MKRKDHATQADIAEHADTQMNIIDEISFADTILFWGKLVPIYKPSLNAANFNTVSTQSVFWVTFASWKPLEGTVFTSTIMAYIGNRQ